jgi:hypothetical protein
VREREKREREREDLKKKKTLTWRKSNENGDERDQLGCWF